MAASDPSNHRIIRAFKSHYAELVEVLADPEQLALRLYSSNFISKGTLEKAIDTASDRMRKSNTVIDAVEAALVACRDTEKASMILSILEKHPPLGSVIAKIRRARSEL